MLPFHKKVIRMNGILLSSLIKETLHSGSQKEGILFGNSMVSTTLVNSDLQADEEHLLEITMVTDFLMSDGVGEFYNSAGQLFTDKLDALLKGQQENSVVGWFRFRWGRQSRPTLRETVVHRELCRHHQAGDSLALLVMTATTDQDTVLHQQQAFRLVDGRLLSVRLEVTNLGETPSCDYRSTPFSSMGLLIPPASSGLDGDNASLSSAFSVQSTAFQHLETQLQRMNASEVDVSAAQRELSELQQRLTTEFSGQCFS